jgi:hypothetical protein
VFEVKGGKRDLKTNNKVFLFKKIYLSKV